MQNGRNGAPKVLAEEPQQAGRIPFDLCRNGSAIHYTHTILATTAAIQPRLKIISASAWICLILFPKSPERKIPNPEQELLSSDDFKKKKGRLPHSKIWFCNLCQIALGSTAIRTINS